MKSRKTIFITLTIGSIVLVSAVIFLLWLIPAIGLVNIHPLLPKLGFAAVIVLLPLPRG
jgi:hypothetical protein